MIRAVFNKAGTKVETFRDVVTNIPYSLDGPQNALEWVVREDRRKLVYGTFWRTTTSNNTLFQGRMRND